MPGGMNSKEISDMFSLSLTWLHPERSPTSFGERRSCRFQVFIQCPYSVDLSPVSRVPNPSRINRYIKHLVRDSSFSHTNRVTDVK